MKMEKEEFIDLLIKKSTENNIELTKEKAEKLYEYKELLLEWNEKINLTSIIEDEDIIVKHFIDSLLCVEYIKAESSVIDVGTGAGFPGIVLAIYFDENIKITLLDSLNKRIIFLNEVINKLELKNVETIHGRAEEIAHKEEYREKYDIAIARAVAPLNILLEYLSGYVKKEGFCVCMKSISAENELLESKNAINILKLDMYINEVKRIIHKKEEVIRQFIILRKNDNIGNKYPRTYGKIKKKPL